MEKVFEGSKGREEKAVKELCWICCELMRKALKSLSLDA